MSQELEATIHVRTASLVDQARLASNEICNLLLVVAEDLERLRAKCKLQESTIRSHKCRIAVLNSRIDELENQLASLRG
jgi:hypothetical protein